ncbi:hypothetical protein F5J12DRAFT_943246 [Pisolithus orientalis]|uniref:uncharacterized protein n=1 Tax=Pisolithus orientalis TaxID=936130 RepID=UPI0022251C38|nr:uncharacterized protein F5J12DRAFT_943246 [Pisolithus orientalis]KAI6003465.1 hypothetical protein F5J12DRAFT_943246 [Pisolithus orientalis]
MFSFTPASVKSEIKHWCLTMEPMANGPWLFGETEQNGESITDEMQICQVTSPTVPESPDCVWNESYQPEKPKERVRLDILHMKEYTPAPVRQLDWSMFEEDDSYLAQPQVDSSSMMGEPHVVSSKKGKGHAIKDGGAVKAYENDLPFILPHDSGDDDPMTII